MILLHGNSCRWKFLYFRRALYLLFSSARPVTRTGPVILLLLLGGWYRGAKALLMLQYTVARLPVSLCGSQLATSHNQELQPIATDRSVGCFESVAARSQDSSWQRTEEPDLSLRIHRSHDVSNLYGRSTSTKLYGGIAVQFLALKKSPQGCCRLLPTGAQGLVQSLVLRPATARV